jgi:hypothetical protein
MFYCHIQILSKFSKLIPLKTIIARNQKKNCCCRQVWSLSDEIFKNLDDLILKLLLMFFYNFDDFVVLNMTLKYVMFLKKLPCSI